jgi:hypothetical protein
MSSLGKIFSYHYGHAGKWTSCNRKMVIILVMLNKSHSLLNVQPQHSTGNFYTNCKSCAIFSTSILVLNVCTYHKNTVTLIQYSLFICMLNFLATKTSIICHFHGKLYFHFCDIMSFHRNITVLGYSEETR